jgi:hypothetical protein
MAANPNAEVYISVFTIIILEGYQLQVELIQVLEPGIIQK